VRCAILVTWHPCRHGLYKGVSAGAALGSLAGMAPAPYQPRPHKLSHCLRTAHCALRTDEMSQARRFARAPPAAAPAVLSGRTSLCSASSRRYRGRSLWSRRLPFSRPCPHPGQQRGEGLRRRVEVEARGGSWQRAGWPLLHPSPRRRFGRGTQGRPLICCDAVVRWLARSRGADEWSRLACVHGRYGWG
jgi:hypothetical protein